MTSGNRLSYISQKITVDLYVKPLGTIKGGSFIFIFLLTKAILLFFHRPDI